MTVNFKGIESLGNVHRTDDLNELLEITPHSPESEPREKSEVMRTIDNLIKTYIRFAPKDNEGQQALIFKYDLETNATDLSKEDQKGIESYIGEAKSIKILKVTDKEAADSEYRWHKEAYKAYEQIPDEEKHKYAGIPEPYINHTLDIDEATRNRLNSQNAKIAEKKASVLVMEWIQGEDLLTKIFRKYLEDRPGYENMASNRLVDFNSLLIAVSGDFRTRGLDFDSMSTLEQYKRLFKDIAKKQSILTPTQQAQIKNTLDLMHHQDVYHNDLHLRNFLVEDGTNKIYIIDFGRTGSKAIPAESDIKDEMVLNFSREYGGDNTKQEQLRKSLDNDINRIVQRDRSFPPLVSSVKTKDGTDLIQFLERESSQWRVDPWNIKKYIALARELESINADKAELVKNFIKDKRNTLPAESQELIGLF